MSYYLLITIIGLILAVSVRMVFVKNRHHQHHKPTKQQDHQGRDDFYQRLKQNVTRLKS